MKYTRQAVIKFLDATFNDLELMRNQLEDIPGNNEAIYQAIIHIDEAAIKVFTAAEQARANVLEGLNE
jgi:hypothetical protein